MVRRGNERNAAYARAGYSDPRLRRNATEAARIDRQRLSNARDIASRYVQNIASMSAFRNDLINKGIEAARERRYSQKTYKEGNNIG